MVMVIQDTIPNQDMLLQPPVAIMGAEADPQRSMFTIFGWRVR